MLRAAFVLFFIIFVLVQIISSAGMCVCVCVRWLSLCVCVCAAVCPCVLYNCFNLNERRFRGLRHTRWRWTSCSFGWFKFDSWLNLRFCLVYQMRECVCLCVCVFIVFKRQVQLSTWRHDGKLNDQSSAGTTHDTIFVGMRRIWITYFVIVLSLSIPLNAKNNDDGHDVIHWNWNLVMSSPNWK